MIDRTYISIIMPAYNAEATIRQSIESVLSQTYPCFELIIVDDASKDETRRIAEQYALSDPRIRVLPNEANSGVAFSRNKGIDEAKYPWIAFLDSDDLWYPDKLEKQMALADAECADIVYCSYAMTDEQGKQKCADFIVAPVTDFESMLAKNVIGCSTVLVKKESLGECRFSTDFYHEDYALWLQLLQKGLKAVGHTEVLVAYRISFNSRSFNKWTSARHRWHIYRKLLNLSFFRSIGYFLRYARNGLKKYRKTD